MRKWRVVYLTLLLTLLLFSTLFAIGLTATGAVNDVTPPEAVITFDPETLSIVVVGVDDFDPDVEVTSVVLSKKHDKTTIKYTLTDDAGNYMKITLEFKEKKGHAEVKVLELSYNGGEAIIPEKNHYKVHWHAELVVNVIPADNVEVLEVTKEKTDLLIHWDGSKPTGILAFEDGPTVEIPFPDEFPTENLEWDQEILIDGEKQQIHIHTHPSTLQEIRLCIHYPELSKGFTISFDDTPIAEWTIERAIKHLHQHVHVHHRFKVNTHFDAKRNETRIDIKVKGQRKEKIILPGLVIVSLVTDKGNLDYRIEFIDSVPPEIVWVFFETPEYDEHATIRAYVTDVGTGVDFVNLSYSADTIGSGNILMSPIDGLFVSEIPPFPYNTTVELVIYAYDKAGNPAVPWEDSYTVIDSYPPVISYVDRIPASPNYNETVSVFANVTEPLNASGVKVVILNYWNGSAWTHVDMTMQDMLYAATIPALPYETMVQYRVRASDWAGNWAASGIYSYTIGAPPNLPPVAKFTESAETVYTGETISFNASESYDPDGNIVSYFWDFGDGTNATDVLAEHAYADDGTYIVTLTVTDDDESTATATSTKIVLNKPPLASFTENATTVLTGEAIYFDASDSYDPDGSIISYIWDFGDETSAAGVKVNHAYGDDGVYTVTLTAIDDDGATASTSAVKTVSNRPPVASFIENVTTVKRGEVIYFDASDSYDPDGFIVSYFWDFGDGTNATGETVDHAYANEGNYTVTLTVTDDDGASSLVKATKMVEKAAGWPLALLAAIGLGIAALTATLLYALYRRRKKKTASSSGSKPIVTLYVPTKILAGYN